MENAKIESQIKLAPIHNYEKARSLMEQALEELTGGDKEHEERALWLMEKTIGRIGVLRNLPYWLDRYFDGFAMETGSAEGFEDAEARIGAFQAGMKQAYSNINR